MRFFIPAVLIAVVDQISKQLIWKNGLNYNFIDGFFRITLVKNAGAAFGIFQGARVFFIIASIIASVFIIYVALKLPRTAHWRQFLLGCILGGAIGNLIDRVLFGEVIDFIEIGFNGHYWPVFNVADMGVSVGATILLIVLMRTDKQMAQPDDSVVLGSEIVGEKIADEKIE